MIEPTPIGRRIRTFEDLSHVSDELLRQLAARVHVVDLAYAFGSADEALRERLLGAVRPGLADDIRVTIQSVFARREDSYPPPDEQIRSSRAQVVQVMRALEQDDY
ncbi:MAG: hypothetical protein HY332_20785 [Chloroflexi bacterium]|nr:hypothetical protein [Chloroflexota bacterium]